MLDYEMNDFLQALGNATVDGKPVVVRTPSIDGSFGEMSVSLADRTMTYETAAHNIRSGDQVTVTDAKGVVKTYIAADPEAIYDGKSSRVGLR